jgi:hypothetical protein
MTHGGRILGSMSQKPKKRTGRPPSLNPRLVYVGVKLTPDEWVIARRVALERRVSLPALLRSAIPMQGIQRTA